jgi:hypothetical protein
MFESNVMPMHQQCTTIKSSEGTDPQIPEIFSQHSLHSSLKELETKRK